MSNTFSLIIAWLIIIVALAGSYSLMFEAAIFGDMSEWHDGFWTACFLVFAHTLTLRMIISGK